MVNDISTHLPDFINAGQTTLRIADLMETIEKKWREDWSPVLTLRSRFNPGVENERTDA